MAVITFGFKLLRSIIEAGSTNCLLNSKRQFFVDDEVPIYDFIHDHFDRYGVIPSMATLAENGISLPPVTETYQYYYNHVKERFIYRSISERLNNLTGALKERNGEACLNVIKDMLASVQGVGGITDFIGLSEEIRNVMDTHRSMRFRTGIIGVTLGWDFLDQLTQGAQRGDVIVYVGRPSVGKSWMLGHSAYKAWESGRPILLGSLEMSHNQMAKRIIGMGTGINPNYFTTGGLSFTAERYVHNVLRDFENRPPLHLISGDFRKSVSDIERIAYQTTPDVVYLDAGYLLTPEKKGFGNKSRRELIADVIEGLKALARNLDVPVVVTVQFNRNVKENMKENLTLESIGETDVIGQIASVVLGIRKGREGAESTERRLELIKNRDGIDGKRFLVNFGFEPVDFSFMEEIVDENQRPFVTANTQEIIDTV
jgi:replicative DNA helicase